MATFFSFIVVIGIIVFFHELGHFIAAKLSGVRVEVFSLGFPPRMIGRKYGETEYQLAWIPFGGYVKMSGMLDESFDEEIDVDDPRGFMAKPLKSKVFIITAGVLMNMVLGWMIYSAVTFSEGVTDLTGTKLTYISPDSPASEAGLAEGDEIIEIDGIPTVDWRELTEIVQKHAGESINFKWLRGDSVITDDIIPRPTPHFNVRAAKMDTVGKIGVVGTFVTTPVNTIEAMGYGAVRVGLILHLNVMSLKALVTGNANVKELTGPLGIAKLSGESIRSGFATFMTFIAMISISIGFLNILPIPMLDGGHLVFILIEAVIKRPIPDKVKMNLMRIGLAAVIALILIVSYHDIIRFYLSNE